MFGGVYFGQIGFGMELAVLAGTPGLVVGGDRPIHRVIGGDSAADGGLVVGGDRLGGLVVGGDQGG